MPSPVAEEITYYESQQNSDMTEGRGPMRAIGAFVKIEDAVAFVKGKGVYGHGDGEVVKVVLNFLSNGVVKILRTRVYGHVRKEDGTWGSGYTDPMYEPVTIELDKDYQTYLEFKERFEGK